MIKCPEGRFDNFTAFIQNVGLTDSYYCMNTTDISLRGSLASKTMSTYYINVAQCNQTTNERYGINKTCETDQNVINAALKHIIVYFNTQLYSDVPLEDYVYTHYANLNPLISTM